MKLKKILCEIDDLIIIEPEVYSDERGYFMEAYNYADLKEIGINDVFVQDNQSKSKRDVLRGLHFQNEFPQSKLVRVISGEVFDVAVDLRNESKTFGKWFGILLSEKNKKQLYIPKGFAHGFLVLSEKAEFFYKVSDYYHPNDDFGIIWNDSDLSIEWPIKDSRKAIVNSKDNMNMTFKEFVKRFKDVSSK